MGVRGFFGITPKVRNWVVGQFTQPAEEVRALRARFEEQLRKFKAAEVKVRETCGGERQGGAWSQEEGVQAEGHCHCPQQKGRGVAGADACPKGVIQKAPSPQVPLAQNACLHPPSFWQTGRDWGVGGGSSCTASLRPCMLGWLKILTWHALMPPRQLAQNFAQEVFGLPCTRAPRNAIKKLYV